jgi:alanine dehydrogenase
VAAAAADRHLAKGLNTYKGKITHKAVAAAVNADFVPFTSL